MTPDELRKYCTIAKEEFGAENIGEAAVVLQGRYNWDINSRLEDFAAAWNDIDITRSDNVNGDDTVIGAPTSISQCAGRIPLVLKKDVLSRSTLLCEVNDEKLSFRGDSGAIGRITVDKSCLSIDLKGLCNLSFHI